MVSVDLPVVLLNLVVMLAVFLGLVAAATWVAATVWKAVNGPRSPSR